MCVQIHRHVLRDLLSRSPVPILRIRDDCRQLHRLRHTARISFGAPEGQEVGEGISLVWLPAPVEEM